MSMIKVTSEQIAEILDNAKVEVKTILDKCTVVVCQLPNGFIIVESSACVDPENYSEELGKEICFKRIKNKVWELEGYRLQDIVSHPPVQGI
jgi:Phage protein (N4 Gp49/phage Sf6 gene 66) family